MHYKVVVFGVKDTTEIMVDYICNKLTTVDLIVTVDKSVLNCNHISGYANLHSLAENHGIPVFKTPTYNLLNTQSETFFTENTFDIGISIGWQRLIPLYVLERFRVGIFGFHGSCGYLPYGRGRSPLNWSILLGDTRFILNLFKYDEQADSPNVFAKRMFEITTYDTIRTLQYKQILCSKEMLYELLESYKNNCVKVDSSFSDIDTWYSKRNQNDGKISFSMKTRDIYNIIRSVSKPFPGAFAFLNGEKITIWSAYPFDGIMDLSQYKPGEVFEVFDGNLLVRTVDGSMIIQDYECNKKVVAGSVLE